MNRRFCCDLPRTCGSLGGRTCELKLQEQQPEINDWHINSNFFRSSGRTLKAALIVHQITCTNTLLTSWSTTRFKRFCVSAISLLIQTEVSCACAKHSSYDLRCCNSEKLPHQHRVPRPRWRALCSSRPEVLHMAPPPLATCPCASFFTGLALQHLPEDHAGHGQLAEI